MLLSPPTSNGVSVLHCAVANGHEAIVQLLLQARANVNPRGTVTSRTPLFLACESGQMGLVRLLVRNGAKVNIKDDYGGHNSLGPSPIYWSYNIKELVNKYQTLMIFYENVMNYLIIQSFFNHLLFMSDF